MKKILLMIVIAITITTPLSAQVFKYRAFQTKYGASGDWETRHILVIINVDREKIHIYGQSETDLSILYSEPSIQKNDGTAYFFQAVDGDANKCTVMLKVFNNIDTDDPDANVATLSISYTNNPNTIFFRLKND